jgi:LytS/YehU family sensor histidine kinase
MVAITLGLDAAFHGSLAMLIYARLRNSRRAALALAEAELGRSEAHRKLLASRLDAARAEVDPAYVIDRLEAIAREYEVDGAAADARLDQLIAFLRSAIPRLRSEEIRETHHEPQGSAG